MATSGQTDCRLIPRLLRRYLLVLAAVAALVIVDQALIQPLLIRLDRFAPVINVTGRQRMLSQRLTKAALSLRAFDEPMVRGQSREELGATLAQWAAAQEALRHGDAGLGIAAPTSPAIVEALEEIEAPFRAMAAAAGALVEAGPSGDAQLVVTIVNNEAAFLAGMERVVTLWEQEAGREVLRLRVWALGIASLIVVLLVGLGWYVVRPAARAIRAQVNELETRVAARTADLAAANEALQHEIAEHEHADARTQRLAGQLAHASRVSTMGHLTAGLAHELNQPLAAIANYAETCGLLVSFESSTDRRVPGHLEQIKRAALRAGGIVRRMRNFVKPTTEPTSQVDLCRLIQEVVELCRPMAEEAGVEIVVELNNDELPVRVDSIQIQQVLVNLAQNGIDAMHRAAGDRRLTVRATSANEMACVEVSDTGPGFTVDPDRVFSPFVTTKPDGLGIGLSICRSIMEQHEGGIWAQSSAGCGATVCFTLPLAPLHDSVSRQPAECVCR